MGKVRHAYLIMAHKNQEQLAILIQMLDSPCCDLFIHLDAKWKSCDTEYLKNRAHHSKVYFTQRISVEWGRYSQVKAELILLQAAVGKGDFGYYHLITGQDLPLKPIEEINAFYENAPEQNYIHFCDDKTANYVARSRAYKYCFPNKIKCLRVVNKVLAFLLGGIGNRTWLRNMYWGYGSAYFDMTNEMAQFVIEKERWIKKHFRTYGCPDELFLQTLINEFGYRNKCNFEISNSYKQIQRYIDFSRGNGNSPYTFLEKDYQELMNSGMNFARKFDWEIDKTIIMQIYSMVCEERSDKRRIIK